MNIPDDLKIFSLIYEYRFFALVPFCTAWMLGGFYLLFRLKKMFFLWLLIFPLVLSPLSIAFVYSGWHYRMELYDRFAKTPHCKFNDAMIIIFSAVTVFSLFLPWQFRQYSFLVMLILYSLWILWLVFLVCNILIKKKLCVKS